MIPFRLYAYAIGVAALVAAGLVAYQLIHRAGLDEGYGLCEAEYQPRIDRMQSEKLAAQQAVIAAQRAKADAEASLAAQLEEQAHEHSKREQALRAGRDGLQRDLVRLRDALATARVSLRALGQPEAAGARPQADGAAAGAGELLGECATQLAEVGGRADSLAAQVIGLQAYARIAHRACGS